jgi:hypothetical protein
MSEIRHLLWDGTWQLADRLPGMPDNAAKGRYVKLPAQAVVHTVRAESTYRMIIIGERDLHAACRCTSSTTTPAAATKGTT